MDKAIQGKILLVGEGDFSFTVAMVTKLPEVGEWEIITTSLETADGITKHRNATENMELLKSKGVRLILEVDATKLNEHWILKDEKFARIIFNFPHAGGKSNHKKNRKLLDDFFKSAVQVLEGQGQIFVTLCKGQGGTPADKPMRAWHDSWQVVSMAANAGLILVAADPFRVDDFETYTSTGFRSLDKGFHTENAVTHVFEMADSMTIPDNIDDVAVTVEDRIYKCSAYIYHKLQILREIEVDMSHPFKLTLQYLTKLFLKEECLRQVVSGSRQNKPCYVAESSFKSSSSVFESRLDCMCKNEVGIAVNNLYSSNFHIQRDKLETENDCQIDNCLTVPHKFFSITKESGCCGCKDGGHILYLRTSLADTFSVRNISLENWPLIDSGPVFRPCLIKFGCLPVQYHMLLVWQTLCTENNQYGTEEEVGTNKQESAEKIRSEKICENSDGVSGDSVKCQNAHKIFKAYLVEKTIKKLKDFLGEHFLIKFTEHNLENSIKVLDETRFETGYNVLGYFLTSLDSEKSDCIPIGELIECKNEMLEKQFRQLALCLYIDEIAAFKLGIKDKRLFYSLEKHVMQQYVKLDFINGPSLMKAPSLYPMNFIHDMSFWENETVEFDEMKFCDVIRNVAGDVVYSVELIDRYKDPGTARYSRCYRMSFQSSDKTLSYDTSWKLQSLIRLEVEKNLKITLR